MICNLFKSMSLLHKNSLCATRTKLKKRGITLLLVALSGFAVHGQKFETNSSNETYIENHILAVSGADLEIAPYRVSKSTTWIFNFLSPTELNQRKTNLINALCKDIGADILIDPQFTYTRRILGGGKLTVTGYPAKYTDFRSLSEKEIDSLILKKDTLENKIIFINQDELKY